MKLFFNFGEKVTEYSYLVINERDARASAGIMFLLGLLSLFSVYIFRTLLWAELFSITFIVEFFIRIVVNPRYAPYMLLASFIVKHQKPEWVEAKPKKFAWSLGLILGAIMGYYILYDVISLFRISICLICLSLMFLESAFGICLGCILYHRLNIKLNNCAGGVCDTSYTAKYKMSEFILLLFFVASFIVGYYMLETSSNQNISEIIIIDE